LIWNADFELGFEMDTAGMTPLPSLTLLDYGSIFFFLFAEIRGILLYKEQKFRGITLELRN
jgi:hypothetical protein